VGGVGLVRVASLARTAAPVAFLAAVTVAVLVVRAGLGGEAKALPSPAHHTKATAAASKLRPPKAKPPAATRVSAAYYRIQSGDTLDAVSRRFGTPLSKLLALNPGVEPTALHVGQRVRIR
jgi:LysM repeat protein